MNGKNIHHTINQILARRKQLIHMSLVWRDFLMKRISTITIIMISSIMKMLHLTTENMAADSEPSLAIL